jgi:hypothetical protein
VVLRPQQLNPLAKLNLEGFVSSYPPNIPSLAVQKIGDKNQGNTGQYTKDCEGHISLT